MKPHQIATSRTVQNAIRVLSRGRFTGTSEADLSDLAKDLHEQIKEVAEGNMRPVETMLYGQAMALQTIFTSLSRRAAANDGLHQFQVNLSLALEAQAQCRATLEALAEIKNPRPVMFARQANISGGPQQVNNGPVPGDNKRTETALAEEDANAPNKLLEAADGNELDIGAQGAVGGADPHLEAVGAVNRAAHP